MQSRILFLLWVTYLPTHNSFQFCPFKNYRKIKMRYAISLKRNDEVITRTKESVVSNMASIVKDDLSNDLLYFMRFYHLTQDDQVSYFYIVFYELLSYFAKQERRSLQYVHISMLNVMVYILIKNIIINQYIHHD